MAKPVAPPTDTDDRARALLERYDCPMPFHAVRTLFLGNIASPDPHASPMQAIAALWGGALPTFDSREALDELMQTLAMGLWSRLTRHQARAAPFRLTRVEVPATRSGMIDLCVRRKEEVEGFLAGLFGNNESLALSERALPERAHRAVGYLRELPGMMQAMRGLMEDPAKPATTEDIAGLLGHYRKLTQIAEHEMHEAVLACKRARAQTPPRSQSGSTTLH